MDGYSFYIPHYTLIYFKAAQNEIKDLRNIYYSSTAFLVLISFMKVLFFVLSLRSFRKYLSWNVNKKLQTNKLWASFSTAANQANFTRTERSLTWILHMGGISLGDRKTDCTLLLPLTHLFQKSNNLFIFFWISRSRKLPPPPPFWDIFLESVCSYNIFAKINRKFR